MATQEEKNRDAGKKKFEIKISPPDENGMQERQIFIDGEFFDWGIDPEAFSYAKKMGPEYFRAAQIDIAKHFLESISEVVGRKVTLQELTQAEKTGWI